MAANTSNNSSVIIISSSEDASDSDSTDYEPEPKKCKLENSQQGEDATLLESNNLVAVPFRATTTVVQYNDSQAEGGGETRTGIRNGIASHGNRSTEDGGGRSLLTVGDLVQQTLEASLLGRGPLPFSRTSPMSQNGLFSQLSDSAENRVSPPEARVRLVLPSAASTSSSSSSTNIPATSAGDFPTIAREVVVRDGAGPAHRGNSQVVRRLRRGRRRNGQDPLVNENDHQNIYNTSQSGSSSSYSSSEYFTDDIDPLDIPSDEYLSPPLPTRQRRNAIFVRRDPPPTSAQNEEDQYYHNELEVASVLDIDENPIEDGSSTSNVDDEVLRRRRSRSPAEPQDIPPVETDNNFADNENVKSDGDSEPTRATTPQPTSSNSAQNASDSPETPGNEKSLCTQCHSQKAQPFFRHCLRCFKIRRTWLPQRPPSRRLKSRKALLRSSNPNSLNNSTNSRTTRSSNTSSEGEDVVDGGPTRFPTTESPSVPRDNANPSSSTQIRSSLPFSQPIDMDEGFLIDDNNPSANRLTPESQPGNVTLMELFTTPDTYTQSSRRTEPETTTSTGAHSQSQQSQSGSSSSQSQQSQGSLFSLNSQNSCGTSASNQSSSPPSQPLQASSPLQKNSTNDIIPTLNSQCSICFVRDKDAAFVHNKIAHLYCCYTCADKILKKNGKCPICRERVLRVVKIISV